MAPTLPLSALTRSWQYPTCIYVRSFTSSTISRQVGPESPRYIAIPEPPQQASFGKASSKGSLPVPRNVFRGKAANSPLESSILRSARPPKHQDSQASADPKRAWKQLLAKTRRKNLREGLVELEKRSITASERLVKASIKARDEKQALYNRPEREDERLTAPSTHPSFKTFLEGSLPDPDREQRLQHMRENVQTKEASHQRARVDALHTLYVHARDFIITENQLNKAIDRVFGTVDEPIGFGLEKLGASAWVDGAPPTAQDMLNHANRFEMRSSDSTDGQEERTLKKLLRIGEELTGGKMVQG